MVSCGRVVCVALPFVLAVVSIVALLVAALAGVADKNLYIFEVNTTGLSVSAADAVNILESRSRPLAARDIGFHDPSLLSGKTAATTTTTTTSDDSTSSNITAADLGLGNLYDIALWNYCVTEQNGTRTCTKAAFNWATTTLNNSENSFNSIISSTGVNLTIPHEITKAVHAFSTLAKWTEVVFLIAFGALALEILFGLFTACSRGVACVTFLIASITVVATAAAAGMATAMAIVVVAAIDAAAKQYGVTASANSGFLAAVWIAAAAAIAASFFWMFTVCCCSPERRSARAGGSRHLDNKALPTGSYQPLHDPHNSAPAAGFNNAAAYAPRYPQGARSDLAYEPYSHSRV